jgi:hypothetical protein
MPSATESTRSIRDAAGDPVTKLNDHIVGTGKRVGGVYLGSCKKSVDVVISAGRKTSGQHREVARTLVEAQMAVAGKLTETYTAVSSKVLAA